MPVDRVHFGEVSDKVIDWRNVPLDDADDDEELESTPKDVVHMLGFDPLELDVEDEFDPDQPRDDRGRWVDVTGLGAKAKWVREKIDQVAEEQDYPKEKIFMSDKVYSFQVNGQSYKAAGVAFTGDGGTIMGGLPEFDEMYDKGDIVIFGKPGFDQDLPVRGVVAHEIEHQKFQFVLESLNTVEGRKFFDKSFPVLKLAAEDGVSKYSKQYWDEWESKRKTQGISNWQTPVHETLAEIARIKEEKQIVTGQMLFKEIGSPIVAPIWQKLFEEVDRRYVELRRLDKRAKEMSP